MNDDVIINGVNITEKLKHIGCVIDENGVSIGTYKSPTGDIKLDVKENRYSDDGNQISMWNYLIARGVISGHTIYNVEKELENDNFNTIY